MQNGAIYSALYYLNWYAQSWTEWNITQGLTFQFSENQIVLSKPNIIKLLIYRPAVYFKSPILQTLSLKNLYSIPMRKMYHFNRSFEFCPNLSNIDAIVQKISVITVPHGTLLYDILMYHLGKLQIMQTVAIKQIIADVCYSSTYWHLDMSSKKWHN